MSKIKEISNWTEKIRIALIKTEFIPIIWTKIIKEEWDCDENDFFSTDVENYRIHSLVDIDKWVDYSVLESIFKKDLVNHIKNDEKMENYKDYYNSVFSLVFVKDWLNDEEFINELYVGGTYVFDDRNLYTMLTSFTINTLKLWNRQLNFDVKNWEFYNNFVKVLLSMK